MADKRSESIAATLSRFGLDDDVQWLTRLREAHGPAPHALPLDYELLAQASRGGQGVVWQARKHSDGSIVALKFLPGGRWARAEARLRIKRELTAVSSLSHPGIVPVRASDERTLADDLCLESDWVHGAPIDVWADSVREGPRGCLRIAECIAAVCSALDHAHERGIIHRDLKPANILVDAQDCPHILDFGLARIAGMPPISLTHSAQFLGTPAFASPEQARCEHDSVDARSDLYSLGVILYYCLTGRMPYPVDGPPLQTLQAVDQIEPLPPRSLRPAIPADLERIVLAALRKDRELRYQSVAAMRHDLLRCIRGEPFRSSAPGFTRELRALARRHRWPFAMGTLVVALVSMLAAGSTIMSLRMGAMHRESQFLLERERQARRAAEHLAYMSDPLHLLMRDGAAARPAIIESLTRSEEVLNTRGGDADAAMIRRALGIGWMRLGELERAQRLLSDALAAFRESPGPEKRDLIETLRLLGLVVDERGEPRQARALFDEARLLAEASWAEAGGHPVLAAILLDQARCTLRAEFDVERARGLLDESIEMLERLGGPYYRDLIEPLTVLGELHGKVDEFEPAARALERASRLNEMHGGIAGPEVDVAFACALLDSGRVEGALELFDRSTDRLRAMYGETSPALATALERLGRWHMRQREYPKAERLLAEALDIWRRVAPGGHLDSATVLENLAIARERAMPDADVEPLLREALMLRISALGPDDSRTRRVAERLERRLREKDRGQ